MKRNPISYVLIILAMIGIFYDIYLLKALIEMKDIFLETYGSLSKWDSNYIQLIIMSIIHLFSLVFGLILFFQKRQVSNWMSKTSIVILIILAISILFLPFLWGLSISDKIYKMPLENIK